jgi:hypothetical protein
VNETSNQVIWTGVPNLREARLRARAL